MLSSDFDDTGTLKSKKEKGEKGPNLGDKKKEEKSLRKLGDEGEDDAHIEGEPSAP